MLPRTRLALISALLGIIVHPFPGEAANPKLPHTHRGMLEVRPGNLAALMTLSQVCLRRWTSVLVFLPSKPIPC